MPRALLGQLVPHASDFQLPFLAVVCALVAATAVLALCLKTSSTQPKQTRHDAKAGSGAEHAGAQGSTSDVVDTSVSLRAHEPSADHTDPDAVAEVSVKKRGSDTSSEADSAPAMPSVCAPCSHLLYPLCNMQPVLTMMSVHECDARATRRVLHAPAHHYSQRLPAARPLGFCTATRSLAHTPSACVCNGEAAVLAYAKQWRCYTCVPCNQRRRSSTITQKRHHSHITEMCRLHRAPGRERDGAGHI